MYTKFLDGFTIFATLLCVFVGISNAFEGDVVWASVLLGLALVNFLLFLVRLGQRRDMKERQEALERYRNIV